MHCNSRPDFSREVFQAKLLTGKASHQQERSVGVHAPVDLSLGLAWQVCEGDQMKISK